MSDFSARKIEIIIGKKVDNGFFQMVRSVVLLRRLTPWHSLLISIIHGRNSKNGTATPVNRRRI